MIALRESKTRKHSYTERRASNHGCLIASVEYEQVRGVILKTKSQRDKLFPVTVRNEP